jgi:hypothetical protein
LDESKKVKERFLKAKIIVKGLRFRYSNLDLGLKHFGTSIEWLYMVIKDKSKFGCEP